MTSYWYSCGVNAVKLTTSRSVKLNVLFLQNVIEPIHCGVHSSSLKDKKAGTVKVIIKQGNVRAIRVQRISVNTSQ
jgi:hypothetical protein